MYVRGKAPILRNMGAILTRLGSICIFLVPQAVGEAGRRNERFDMSDPSVPSFARP